MAGDIQLKKVIEVTLCRGFGRNECRCFANERYAVETRPSQCLDIAMMTTSARHALTDVGTLRQLPLGLIGEDRTAKSNLQAGTVKTADPTRAMIGGAVHLETAITISKISVMATMLALPNAAGAVRPHVRLKLAKQHEASRRDP